MQSVNVADFGDGVRRDRVAVTIAVDTDGVALAVAQSRDEVADELFRAATSVLFGYLLYLVRVLRCPPEIDLVLERNDVFLQVVGDGGAGLGRGDRVDVEEVTHRKSGEALATPAHQRGLPLLQGLLGVR